MQVIYTAVTVVNLKVIYTIAVIWHIYLFSFITSQPQVETGYCEKWWFNNHLYLERG